MAALWLTRLGGHGGDGSRTRGPHGAEGSGGPGGDEVEEDGWSPAEGKDEARGRQKTTLRGEEEEDDETLSSHPLLRKPSADVQPSNSFTRFVS